MDVPTLLLATHVERGACWRLLGHVELDQDDDVGCCGPNEGRDHRLVDGKKPEAVDWFCCCQNRQQDVSFLG